MVRNHHLAPFFVSSKATGSAITDSVLASTSHRAAAASTSTASHASISSSHQHNTNNPIVQMAKFNTSISGSKNNNITSNFTNSFTSLSKMVSASGAQDPTSTAFSLHATNGKNNTNKSGFTSRFFRTYHPSNNSNNINANTIKENIDGAVREAQSLVANNNNYQHGSRAAATTQPPYQWWYYHGPQFGWLNYAPQILPYSSSALPPHHRGGSQKQTVSLGAFILRIVFPWFVFFLVIGEMADYFIGELAIATATSTTSSSSTSTSSSSRMKIEDTKK